MRGVERSGRALWITGLATFGLLAVLGAIDGQLRDSGGPGIIPFQLEFTSENARETLALWGAAGRDDAVLSLWVDYPFLVAYAAFYSLAIAKLCAALGWRRWEFLALLPLGAAVADAVENAALLMAIGQNGDQPWPLIGGVFASAKWALIAPVPFFLVIALVAWAVRRVNADAR